jgi:hypothetical protein
MWAQLVRMRAKSGSEDKLQRFDQQWQEQVGRGTDSGWVRSFSFKNANDPNEWYELVFFESEDKARRNEGKQQHQAVLQQMMPLLDGQPEYVDLTLMEESTR